MKNKILTLIFSVLFIIPSIFLISACGKEPEKVEPPALETSPDVDYEVRINGLIYDRDVENQTYYVKGCDSEIINNIVTVEIEDEIEGLPVTKINRSVFYDTDTSYYSDNKIKLHNIIIPNTILNIDGAFNGCVDLETITFENGSQIESIASYTFDGCLKLKNIEFPSSLKNLGDCSSFIDSSGRDLAYSCGLDACNSLETITFAEGSQIKNIWLSARLNGNLYNFKNLELPEGLETLVIDYIGHNLEIENLPNSLKHIYISDTDSFADSCFVENGIMYMSNRGEDGSNVNKYFVMIDVENKNLDSYTINNNTKLLNGCAVRNLSNVLEIIIPDSITSLSLEAFSRCDKLEAIQIYKNAANSISAYRLVNSSANKLYIEVGADIDTLILSNFTLNPNSDKEGFLLFIRNEE